MPAFVGAIHVISIGSSGVMNIGDVFSISPNSSAKTFAGAGSFITGDYNAIDNHFNYTTTYDSEFTDQPMILNR